MKTTDFAISFEKVYFRTCLLVYRDDEGTARAYFEESAVSEFDWIAAEPDFGVSAERLLRILPRIHEWANSEEWCRVHASTLFFALAQPTS